MTTLSKLTGMSPNALYIHHSRQFHILVPHFKPPETWHMSRKALHERIASYQHHFSSKQWGQFLSSSLYPNSQLTFNLDLFEAAVIGVKRAVGECRFQFRQDMWNCTHSSKSEDGLFGSFLLKGTPQTAFVYAIVNAGIAQAVAEACHDRIDNCPCNNHGRHAPDADWQWQGCDHNIHYARKFSRRLLDVMEGGEHLRFRVNLHNNEVGRQQVVENMERYCRCHGTSGSCTLKTCYRRTSPMRTLGNRLREIYDRHLVFIDPAFPYLTYPRYYAHKVYRRSLMGNHRRRTRFSSHRGLPFPRGRLQEHFINIPSFAVGRRQHVTGLPPARGHQATHSPIVFSPPPTWAVANLSTTPQQPSLSQLVYHELLPNQIFCQPIPLLNIVGTHGRQCNSSSSGPDACSQLCCRRGYATQHFYAMESCNCKFIWCCRVECQQCLVLKRVDRCN